MKNNLEKDCEESFENVCQKGDKNYFGDNKQEQGDNEIKKPGFLGVILNYLTRNY
jgi:hypothetical protein